MKLTKSERCSAYMIMLAELEWQIEDHGYCFLCHAADAIGLMDGHNDKIFEKILPELWAKKPTDSTERVFWFYSTKDGDNKRIEILKQCIIETL